jgi:DNA (cytosine-5)-methyltransferase 1
MSFKYISLFSGIGGFDHAFNQLGGECVLAAEWDKYAQISYKAQFGNYPQGDVTKIAEQDVPDHQVLLAGFPCQSFSVAGLQRGFEDARGTLFFEAARIAKYKQPEVLLFENVKGLVSHDKGQTLEVMIRTLDEIGYTIDFEVLNSKYFGVPQSRERIWICAVRNDLVQPEPWVLGKRTDVVAKGKKRMAALGIRTFNFDWPKQETVAVRLRDILETNVDEKYYLSDEKTAKLIEQLESRGEPDGDKDVRMVGRADIDGHDFNKRIYSVDGVSRTLNTASDIGRSMKIAEPQAEINIVGNSGNGHGAFAVHSADGLVGTLLARDYKDPKRVLVDDMYEGREVRVYEDTAPTLRSERHGLKVVEEVNGAALRKRTEMELEIRTDGLSNALTQNVDHHLAAEVRPVLTPDYTNKRQNGTRFKDNDEPAYTLTAQDVHGVALSNDDWQSCSTRTRSYRGQEEQLEVRNDEVSNTITSVQKDAYVTNKYRIRKLTPYECWKLQGFSTESFLAAQSAGVSNSQLYKQAGNSVTIPLVRELGSRLIKFI